MASISLPTGALSTDALSASALPRCPLAVQAVPIDIPLDGIWNEVADRATVPDTIPDLGRREIYQGHTQHLDTFCRAWDLDVQQLQVQLVARTWHRHDLTDLEQALRLVPCRQLGKRIAADQELDAYIRSPCIVEQSNRVYGIGRPFPIDVDT